MCGRFAATPDPARLAEQLDALDETGGAVSGPNCAAMPDYAAAPNYNVAPTTAIAAVVARHDEGGDDPTRRIRLMRWGLLPAWVKAAADGRPLQKAHLINARAETLTTSPAYRSAAEHKRCLVPMDGYYEWKPSAANPKRARKTPFFFFRSDGHPLLVAGLWSAWKPDRWSGAQRLGSSPLTPAAQALLTCVVITTDAVGEFASIHDRMPLILGEDDWDRWLNPDHPVPEDLLANPPDVTGMAMREVSTLVNSVSNNGPELIAPVDPGLALF